MNIKDLPRKGPHSISPIRKAAPMKKFQVHYVVHYNRGMIEIDAENEDEARRAFERIDQVTLVDKSIDVTTEIENIKLIPTTKEGAG